MADVLQWRPRWDWFDVTPCDRRSDVYLRIEPPFSATECGVTTP